MKTQYQHIHFVKKGDNVYSFQPRTSIWECRNNRNGGALGMIHWYGPWRQYCYSPMDESAVYSRGCLEDIASFLAELAEERKQQAMDRLED